MQALIIGDRHGEMPEIPEEGFDMIMAVGDICGGADRMRSTMFEAIDNEKEWYELFGEEEVKRSVKSSIEEGKEILSELNSLDVPVFVVPGNWDWTGENSDWKFLADKGYPKMLEEFENIHNLNFDSQEVKGWTVIGYGPCSGPEIPQYEDEKPETDKELEEIKEEYREKKEELFEKVEVGENFALLSHNVP
ncbi:MAG: metallophosphoesterase [Candidatus Nanohaloarchaea archaeon]